MSRLIDTIILDSKDRLAISVSSTQYSVRIDNPGVLVNYWKLRKVMFPLVYDNIVTGLNDTCTIDGTLLTIPAGHYDVDSLLTQLNALSVAGTTWTFDDNYRFTITRVGAFVFLEGTLARTLGFDDAAYAGAVTYTADWYPNLALFKDYFTIHSRILSRIRTHSYLHSDYRGDLLGLIPHTGTHGDMLMWEPEKTFIIKVKDHSMTTVDIIIRDSANTVLDLDGRSVTMVWERYA